jgi:hypothetical protein
MQGPSTSPEHRQAFFQALLSGMLRGDSACQQALSSALAEVMPSWR